MQITASLPTLQEILAAWRSENQTIALVPTMGNLHLGHCSLIDLAKEHADRVVVSIFVNPLQFSAGEDFTDYPRTLSDDCQQAQSTGVDLMFTPTNQTLYPQGEHITRVVPPLGLEKTLCGIFRPEFFSGVTTVVSKLFHLVQPDIAVFGQKDYQQGLIIQHMIDDLNFPVQMIMAETYREPDGLAFSSRNQYLLPEERIRASELYKQCQYLKKALIAGRRDYQSLCDEVTILLTTVGFRVDYVAIRRANDLSMPDDVTQDWIVLIAAWLGKARLIDNIQVSST